MKGCQGAACVRVQVACDLMERHSACCAAADEVVSDGPCDARLTRLAALMEERMEGRSLGGLAPDWEDLETLVLACRTAAALQPDGTSIPAERCEVATLTTPASNTIVREFYGGTLSVFRSRSQDACCSEG